MTAAPVLEFRDIRKTYGRTDVLRGVSLAIPAGDFMVLYGAPASGKSVLLRILMGLENADSGAILLRGQDVTRWAAADRNIGYVPQSFALYPHISVRDNIAYPLELAGIGASAGPIVDRAAEMLRITEHLDKRPDQLSGGQKQRVAIARGIAKQSDLYVLDDPLAGLDFKLREQLVEDLRALKSETNATFLYATSDIVEAMTLADTLSVLDRGAVVETGFPAGLYDAPANLRTMALVGFPTANFLQGTVGTDNGRAMLQTPLFASEVELLAPVEGPVIVGLRPEQVRVSTGGEPGAGVALPARVLLREDLGGEEIVYLEAQGQTLTSVDRHTLDHSGDGEVTIHIHPSDLALFDPRGGGRVGRGIGSDKGQA
ncbi:MAG: ABC transporter ATP-binding protein [Chloroflexota bacterium]